MKKAVTLFLAAILLLSLSSCMAFGKLHIGTAVKLEITDGTTGEVTEITDEETIAKITENIESLSFKKMGKIESDGFTYSIRWCNIDGSLIEQIALKEDGHHIVKGEYYYLVRADLNIDMDLIAEAIKNA